MFPFTRPKLKIGHAVTWSFTLNVYGGKPEWARNLEAARLLGAEIEKAVAEAEKKPEEEGEADVIGGLSPIQQKGLGAAIP